MVKYFNLNRKVIAYKTTESWTSVPHVSFIYEADVTKALQVLKTVNEQSGIHITLNTLMLKIFTEAIKAAPQINAHIKYNPGCISGKIEYKKQVNISVPLLLANQEMVTINLLGFENKSLTQMQEYIDRTKEKIENCNIEIPLYRVCIENLKSDFKNGHFLKVLGAIVGTIIGKSKTSKPKKDKPYNEVLSRLFTACEGFSAVEADQIMEEIEIFDYEADDGLVLWLRENINQMNFMEITEKLSSIIK